MEGGVILDAFAPGGRDARAPRRGASFHTFFLYGGVVALAALSPIAVFGATAGVGASAADKIDFNYQIRPIISAKCFHCHGPDESSRKAHLRLDSRAEAMTEHKGLTAIVPGDPEASELVARVTSTDGDEVMPPPKEHKTVTPEEAALLRRWIAEGAEYKVHWSFAKPERPALVGAAECGLKTTADWPADVRAEDWSRNPLDGFVLQKMTAGGLKPSPEADPYTLCRRLYLDLTGLPPAPAEVAGFVADFTADRTAAVARLADRLMASPHFGEKWARMWLDLARYADSTGYGSDKFRLNIWPWRDWVIQAFNDNLPYDRFTLEQIAGDLLPESTRENQVATAFHRNTMTNVEGGIVPEEFRVAAVKDRISTTAEVWMGLTMQCAQCHSHKFDPISQKEYYQFFAIFNQTEDANREDEEPRLALLSAEDQAKTDRLNAEIADLEKKLHEAPPEYEAERRAWEKRMRRPVDWIPLTPDLLMSSAGAVFTVRPDGSILAEGRGDKPETFMLETRSPLAGVTAFRLELLPDDALPSHGPGRAPNGNVVINEFSVAAAPAGVGRPRGRFVRIEAPGKDRILSLAEVQVFAGAENVARKGVARQSSTDFAGEASRAIDGQTDGDYNKNSVTHTQHSDDPWWEVDLGADAVIDRISIWNRMDGGLGTRLAGSRLKVLDAERKVVAETAIAAAPLPVADYSPITGEKQVALRNASADFSQADFGVEKAIDGKPVAAAGWALAPETGKAHTAVFEAATPIAEAGATLVFHLVQNYGSDHVLGHFRVSVTSQAPPVRALPPAVAAILAVAEGARSPEQAAALDTYYRPLTKSYATITSQIAARRKDLAAIKNVRLPVMRELPRDKRRENHLLVKGNYLAPAETLQPALPAAFSSWFPTAQPPDRLTVARWLVNPENPLTARVAANRFWAQLFGLGIVETEEDFGSQGALPVNPQLLDWLAVAFESPKSSDPAQLGIGWDMKALIKLIVTSATYSQSSRSSPEALEKDSRDRLLSHYPRRRLEAETVRDQALALSGLLAPKIGGPSVYPPQPDGLWSVAFNGGQNGYPTSKGDDRYRRGLYTFWRRTQPYPSMATFDAPSRESCTLRRLPTNTPLQAFVTMNDPCFVECAQALARRIVKEGGADAEARLRWALQLALARPAEESQLAALRQLLEAELAEYQADPEAAKKLAASETQPLPAGADAAELAAWTVVANVLLNLDGVLAKS